MARAKRFKTRRSRIALATVCVIVLALIAFFVYRGVSGEATAALTYTTGTVQKMTLTSSVSGTGYIEYSNVASVSPAVAGDVAGLSVKLGDTVQQGQVLFTLVNPQLDVAVAEAQTAYDKAVLGVEQAKLDVLQAKKDLTDLYSKSHTALQVKQAKAAVTAAELAVTAAENAVTSARVALEQARNDAAARTVTAPLTGVVTTLSIENGDSLQASSGGSGSSAPMTITNTDTYQATITLAESDISAVKVGQKAMLTLDALPDLTLSGKVTRVDATGTNDQGVVSYSVIVTPDVMDPTVKGGMTVSVNIITNVASDVLAVPSSAVKSSADGPYVQVIENGGPVDVAVETGLSNDSYTEITSGLTEGQEIVTGTSQAGGSTVTTTRSSGNAFGEGGFILQGTPSGGFAPPGR